MYKRLIFLTIGIVDLALSYVLFTPQEYFSFFALAGIFLLVAIGLILLLLPYFHEAAIEEKKHAYVFAILAVISLVIIILEASYNLAYISLPSTASVYIISVLIATALFAAGLYLIKKNTTHWKSSYQSYLLIFLLLLFLSVLIYTVQLYSIHATQWKGTDEIAFNYYASYLLLHGTNPYNTTMSSILSTNHLTPTYELNGTCECSYDYPAAGFLLLAPLALFKNFLDVYAFVGIIVTVLVGFLLYKKSKFGNYALLPIIVWFAAIFYFIAPAATLTSIIAVSLLLLIAYIYRAKIIISGALMGIAVSMHQLAWFVAPFFYIIILRESGKKAALKSILITALIFILFNSYFIAVTPYKTLDNIFSLFLTKLQFTGPSLIQLLVTFFPSAYWSLTAVIAVIFVASLFLFYFYNDTLRPLLVVVPILTLFLSWRSMPAYSLVFIPLLIGIYYFDKNEKQKNLSNNKNLLIYVSISVVILALCIIVYAHSSYLTSNQLSITSTSYNTQKNLTTGNLIISNIKINIANNANATQPIVFYLVSRNPDFSVYTVDSSMPTLPPHSNYTYVFPVSALQLNPKTKIEVFVLDNDNIVSTRIK